MVGIALAGLLSGWGIAAGLPPTMDRAAPRESPIGPVLPYARAWSVDSGFPSGPGPISAFMVGSRVLVVAGNGALVIDRKTGRRLGHFDLARLTHAPQDVYTQLAVGDSLLFALALSQVADTRWAITLWAIDCASGLPVWHRVIASSNATLYLATSRSCVYVGGADGSLLAFRTNSGTPLIGASQARASRGTVVIGPLVFNNGSLRSTPDGVGAQVWGTHLVVEYQNDSSPMVQAEMGTRFALRGLAAYPLGPEPVHVEDDVWRHRWLLAGAVKPGRFIAQLPLVELPGGDVLAVADPDTSQLSPPSSPDGHTLVRIRPDGSSQAVATGVRLQGLTPGATAGGVAFCTGDRVNVFSGRVVHPTNLTLSHDEQALALGGGLIIVRDHPRSFTVSLETVAR
ncbi:MAG TPA: PQQ-binding-like beta-propeller repeat protein [Fimbriimonadaceae bacterium]|nr:PQQ-binding-like beta-propeller repeat protein [Fimbriimonadaceae bacterium]